VDIEGIAFVSKCPYRAESLALVLSEKLGCRTQALTPAEMKDLTEFSLVLVDLDSEVEGNFEWIRSITSVSATKIVLLGLVESEENVIKAAEAGANGYITSTASIKQLVTTLISVSKGEFTCPSQFTYALFEHLAFLVRSNSLAPKITSTLSARERKILELVSQNLTNKEIAARLSISDYTAKNHVHRILRKLGASSRLHASASPQFRWTVRASSR